MFVTGPKWVTADDVFHVRHKRVTADDVFVTGPKWVTADDVSNAKHNWVTADDVSDTGHKLVTAGMFYWTQVGHSRKRV